MGLIERVDAMIAASDDAKEQSGETPRKGRQRSRPVPTKSGAGKDRPTLRELAAQPGFEGRGESVRQLRLAERYFGQDLLRRLLQRVGQGRTFTLLRVHQKTGKRSDQPLTPEEKHRIAATNDTIESLLRQGARVGGEKVPRPLEDLSMKEFAEVLRVHFKRKGRSYAWPHHLVRVGERLRSQWPDLKEAYTQFAKGKESEKRDRKGKMGTQKFNTLSNRWVAKLEELELVLKELLDAVKVTVKRMKAEFAGSDGK